MEEDPIYQRDPDRLATLARRFGWMMAALFLFLGVAYLVKGIGVREPLPLRLADVRLVPEPPYPLAALMEEVKRLGRLPDPLPAELGPNFPSLADALAKHPWIAAVEEFRHLRADDVEIAVRWRTPLLEFEQAGQRFFLSQDRIALPWREGLKETPLRVVGLKLPPKLVGGERLDPPALAEILAAESALRGEWQAWKLTGIEVEPDAATPTLGFRTAGGSLIVWRTLGRREQEVSEEDKKHRLRRYLQEYGSFEMPNGPYLLDARPKSGLSRMTLKKVSE